MSKPKKSVNPHGRRYPWDEWFAKETKKLRKDKDFHCALRSMVPLTYGAARKRGILVSISSDEERGTLTVKVVGTSKTRRGRKVGDRATTE